MIDVDAGWQDVLRRSRRGRTRRVLVTAAVLVVVLASAGSALALLLSRPANATLPPQADATKAMVVLDPHTGQTLLQVAPWTRHPGVCYVVLRKLAGCTRTFGRHETVLLSPPRVLMTFDARVVRASGARLYRFPRYHVSFALPLKTVCRIRLFDRAGKTIALVHDGCR